MVFRAHREAARAALPVLMAAVTLLAGCGGGAAGDRRETVTIDGREFHLELAITDESRTRGLMGVEQLAADEGMLFVFPRAQIRSFWMVNCLIDIDIMFLDPQGRVTAIHQMKAEPPKADNETQAAYEARLDHYWSNFPAQFAIELQGGMLDEIDVSVEDKIALDLDRLKKMAR
ncbi:MAG: DUF192 domain-containing protein [Planctomycetota bacterium]|jgi:uncharacterized membrane protein (UPF0127 family)